MSESPEIEELKRQRDEWIKRRSRADSWSLRCGIAAIMAGLLFIVAAYQSGWHDYVEDFAEWILSQIGSDMIAGALLLLVVILICLSKSRSKEFDQATAEIKERVAKIKAARKADARKEMENKIRKKPASAGGSRRSKS